MRYVSMLAGLALASGAAAQTSPGVVEGDVPIAKLLEAAAKYKKMFPETLNKYFPDVEKPKTISMYGIYKPGATTYNATYWEADLDVDCDGKASTNCNKARDPWFQPQLSASGSLQSEFVPHIVIPISSPSNSKARGIEFGQIGLVIHKNAIVYGTFLDECGVKELIGEASYAAVKLLGVNPDPHHGGTDEPTQFFYFTGPTGRHASSADWGNHEKAIEIGNRRAKELMAELGIDWQNPSDIRPIHADRFGKGLEHGFSLGRSVLNVSTAGAHTVSMLAADGRKVFTRSGSGHGSYALESVKPGMYVVNIAAGGESVSRRAALIK